ncbi:hypothetical protein ACLOJK_027109, partial [Asimina triloba]
WIGLHVGYGTCCRAGAGPVPAAHYRGPSGLHTGGGTLQCVRRGQKGFDICYLGYLM